MRFKTDENMHAGVAAVLRAAGHDAETARGQGLGGSPDADLARACLLERRAIVTQDLDFADVRVYPPAHYAGIAVLRLASQDVRSQLAVMRRLTPLFADEPLVGMLWIVDDTGVRIRGAGRADAHQD